PPPRRDNARMNIELIRKLPKTDLHVHLDGSLRLSTLIELAKERKIPLPSETEAGLNELVFRSHYPDLGEYLQRFGSTVAARNDAEALERAAFELCGAGGTEGACSLEPRFAPRLPVRPGFEMAEVVRAVDRGLRRAERQFNASDRVTKEGVPPFHA